MKFNHTMNENMEEKFIQVQRRKVVLNHIFPKLGTTQVC